MSTEKIVIKPEDYEILIKGKIKGNVAAVEYQYVHIGSNNIKYLVMTVPYGLSTDFKEKIGEITGKYPVWVRKLEGQLNVDISGTKAAWFIDDDNNFQTVLDETAFLAIDFFDWDKKEEPVIDIKPVETKTTKPIVTKAKPQEPIKNKTALAKPKQQKGIIQQQQPTNLAKYSDIEKINEGFIKKYYTQGKQVDEAEVFFAVQTCKALKLNPVLKEIYTYPSGRKLTMVVPVNTKLKDARKEKDYNGVEFGLVIQYADSKDLIEVEGELLPPGSSLIGGWARVHVKDIDFPFVDRVNLEPYDKSKQQYGGDFWRKNAAGMIAKTALSHALTRAFPDLLGSVYSEDEMYADFNPS